MVWPVSAIKTACYFLKQVDRPAFIHATKASMDASPGSTQPFYVCPVADLPVLVRMLRALRSKLTRVWPTRYQSLCPPACAALLDMQALQAPELLQLSSKCLVMFLPDDYAADLGELFVGVFTHQMQSLLD